MNQRNYNLNLPMTSYTETNFWTSSGEWPSSSMLICPFGMAVLNKKLALVCESSQESGVPKCRHINSALNNGNGMIPSQFALKRKGKAGPPHRRPKQDEEGRFSN